MGCRHKKSSGINTPLSACRPVTKRSAFCFFTAPQFRRFTGERLDKSTHKTPLYGNKFHVAAA
jgi:hypothetical protein